MKIAVTADVHLTNREAHPERVHALQSIIKTMKEEKCQHLIIAGDLFDADYRNYSEFDEFCQKHKDMTFLIIPGNHDAQLRGSSFAASNIRIFEEPELVALDLMSRPILFIPYLRDKSMGQIIVQYTEQLINQEWVLVGHGDWIEGMREVNPVEPGIYMPLTRVDFQACPPICGILGHIHKSLNTGPVYYPGSPCPMHINETGKRQILMLDSESGQVKPVPITSDILYFRAELVILPLKNEQEYIEKQINAMAASWQLDEEAKKKTRIRVVVTGYSANKKALDQMIRAAFKGFAFLEKDAGPDLSEVYDANDAELAEIAERTASAVARLPLEEMGQAPSREEILMHALHTIYGT